jgi:hypothetical protein
MVFVKKEKDKFVKIKSTNANSKLLYPNSDVNEFVLFRYELEPENFMYVLFIYKHPKVSNERLYNNLKEFLTIHFDTFRIPGFDLSIRKKLIIIGDFNINFKSKEKGDQKFIQFLMEKFDLYMAIDHVANQSTFDKNTLIDWCLYNGQVDEEKINCQCYKMKKSAS